MKSTLYTIECITNLHVGSGEDNFGVVDNLIQRDSLTQYPCINASSLKGALRNHCKTLWKQEKNEEKSKEKKETLFRIFGKEGDDKKASNQGNFRFLDAHLYAFPRPSEESYCELITSQAIVDEIGSLKEDFKIKSAANLFNDVSVNPNFHKIVGKSLLPVISRICLDEKNRNLWYEEILPRKSKLYFFVLHDDDCSEFEDAITKHLVQIGANASVGYGICKIIKIATSSDSI